MIPSSVIKEYLYAKFSVNKVFGEEFITNSVFVPDEKLKMSINMESGLWQDFKAHEKGNFPQLVAAVEDIPYDQALHYLRSKLFDTPQHLFDISSINVRLQTPTNKNSVAEIFKSFRKFDFKNINESQLTDRLARKFVYDRNLAKVDLYICKKGRYANRVIIPYAYGDGKPFYMP